MKTDHKRVETAVFQQAKKGQTQCGDSYFYTETKDGYICALADGLGSGEHAKISSETVIDIIKNNTDISVERLVEKCTQALAGKRGAVLGILKIDFHSGFYSFSSIGNIGVLTIFRSGRKKRSIPDSGYLSGHHRPFKVVTEQLEPQTNFIMFSDGVSDTDLAQQYLLDSNVNQIVHTYKTTFRTDKNDDTTFIAIRYNASNP